MAHTQVEAARLSNDMLVRGVIDIIVKDWMILQFLPFMDITGTSVRYTCEATMPSASFHAPLGTWSEATPTFTSHTANLTPDRGPGDRESRRPVRSAGRDV